MKPQTILLVLLLSLLSLLVSGYQFPLKDADCYHRGNRVILTSWYYMAREDLRPPGTLYRAINIPCRRNSPIFSIASGEVIETGYNFWTGMTISIKDKDGTVIKYGHLSDWGVIKGDKVGIQQIGVAGRTGRTTGTCLYLEAVKDGQKICISSIDKNGYCANFDRYWYCEGDGSIGETMNE